MGLHTWRSRGFFMKHGLGGDVLKSKVSLWLPVSPVPAPAVKDADSRLPGLEWKMEVAILTGLHMWLWGLAAHTGYGSLWMCSQRCFAPTPEVCGEGRHSLECLSSKVLWHTAPFTVGVQS